MKKFKEKLEKENKEVAPILKRAREVRDGGPIILSKVNGANRLKLPAILDSVDIDDIEMISQDSIQIYGFLKRGWSADYFYMKTTKTGAEYRLSAVYHHDYGRYFLDK